MTDLERLAHENAQLNRQVTDIQRRCTELLEEKRRANVDYAVRDLKTSKKKFIKQIERLSEDLATELEQAEVIVEIQKDGVTQRAFGMGPRL